MSRWFQTLVPLGIAALLLSVVVIGSGSVLAGKGGESLTTTISLGSETRVAADSSGAVYGDATFIVTRSIPYDKETIWVTNKCWDAAGNLVQRQDNPVLWGTSVSLVGTTWFFPTGGGVTCTAYVTLRPWQDRPLGDAIMSFSVGQ